MTRTNQTTTNNDARRLAKGTAVVSKIDGEMGRIIKVCTQNKPRTKATSYVVQTSQGREIWDAQDIFLPDGQD